MRERLVRIGKLAVQVVAVGGGLVALISFFFGDLGEILGRLEPYQTPIIGGMSAIVLLAVNAWIYWIVGREIWCGIRGWIRKRRDSRQLRNLIRSIVSLKQVVYWRSVRLGSDEGYLDVVIRRQDEVSIRLAEIGIPVPVRPENPNYAWELERWAMYLDILLPLAIKGDIDEARMVLHRLEEMHDKNPVVRRTAQYGGGGMEEIEK